jgi:uncharacterized protein YkwD
MPLCTDLRFITSIRRKPVIAVATLMAAASLPTAPALGAKVIGRAHHARHHRRHTHRGSSASVTASLSACPNADTRATKAAASDMRGAVVCLINEVRVIKGLPALNPSAKLDNVAKSWSNWMVSNDQFTHGLNFAGRVTASGYDWQTAGENIATGAPTPRAVVVEWLRSTDHCRNILNPEFRDIGVGVNPSPIRGFGWGGSTWTQDFGLTMGASAPSGNTGPMNGCPY